MAIADGASAINAVHTNNYSALLGYKPVTLMHGDCLEALRTLGTASVDAIVTDPPAGINFMQKDFDSDRGGRDAWIAWLAAIMREALRVTKPGGHALVWSLPRTSHWTATALEDAGWCIRDCVAHLTGQGFPKSHNLHGEWEGYGTALKPGMELWWLARAPLSEKTVAANVSRWGTGALHIGATRIGTAPVQSHGYPGEDLLGAMKGRGVQGRPDYHTAAGRWPANVVLSHTPQCRLVRADGFQDRSHDGDHIACVGDAGQMHSDGAASSIDGSVTLSVAGAPMLSGVQFNGQPNIGQPEVNDKSPAGVGDDMLVLHDDTDGAQRIRNGPLNIGDRQGTPSGVACGTVSRHSGDVPNTADIQTGNRAEYAPIRTTDTGDMRLEAAPAHRAQACLPGFGSATTIDIRTGPRTRRALPHAELSVGDAVGDATNVAIVGVTGHQSPLSDYTTPQPETVEAWDCAPDCAIFLLDQQSGERRAGGHVQISRSRQDNASAGHYGVHGKSFATPGVNDYADTGGASRFFYVAKASSRERSAGLPAGERNPHPTVKSLALCDWLVRLVTPPGGVVLDPFCGSGSIGASAVRQGFQYMGMDQDASYLAIAEARIAYWGAAQPAYGKADTSQSGWLVDSPLPPTRTLERVGCD